MNIAAEQKSNLSKTVLVLGAGGRLGQAATKAFAQAGWQVLTQARKPMHKGRWGNVRHIQADALEVETIAAQCGAVDVIVHALNPDYARWEELLPPQTAAVQALALKLDAVVMIPGNVYNFGQELPAVLTETTPFVANTDKARQRIAMEASFAAAADRGLRTVVIRAGDFIGGSGTWLDMGIAKQLHKGVFTLMGPDHIAHAWAYLPDLARVFVKVAEQREQLAAYEVLHFPGELVRTLPQVAHLQHRAQHRRKPRDNVHHAPGHGLTFETMSKQALKTMLQVLLAGVIAGEM